MKRPLYFLLLFLASGELQAAGNTVTFTQTHDWLDQGYREWNESSLVYSREMGSRQLFSAGVQLTDRFGLNDTQFSAAYVHPLSSVLTVSLDLTASPSHNVLARHAAGGMLQYELRPAWLVHGGGRITDYEAVQVNQGILMLEHYFSRFSWLAGWRPTRAFGTTAHTAELRGSYYYGERNSVSLIMASGKEATSLDDRVVLTDVNSVALVGRHWFDPRWALAYSAGMTRQGDFYTRTGVSLGIHLAF